MRQSVFFVVNLCLSGVLLLAPAWPQRGGEWIVDTIAGGELGDGGPAVQAQLSSPSGVALDRAGNNPFLAYGVVNDGGAPGQRSGDGAYVPAARDQRQGGR